MVTKERNPVKLSENWLEFLSAAKFKVGRIEGNTLVYDTAKIVIDLTLLPSDPAPGCHRKLIQLAYIRMYEKTEKWAQYQRDYQKKRTADRRSTARTTKRAQVRSERDLFFAVDTMQSLQIPAYIRAFDRIVSGEAVLS